MQLHSCCWGFMLDFSLIMLSSFTMKISRFTVYKCVHKNYSVELLMYTLSNIYDLTNSLLIVLTWSRMMININFNVKKLKLSQQNNPVAMSLLASLTLLHFGHFCPIHSLNILQWHSMLLCKCRTSYTQLKILKWNPARWMPSNSGYLWYYNRQFCYISIYTSIIIFKPL